MKQGVALYERRLGLQVGAAGFHLAPQRRFILHLPIGHHPTDQPPGSLHRLQLRRVGRKKTKPHALWHLYLSGGVPARPIQHQPALPSPPHAGKRGQHQVEGLRRDRGQQPVLAFPGSRSYEGIHLQPAIAGPLPGQRGPYPSADGLEPQPVRSKSPYLQRKSSFNQKTIRKSFF